MPHDNKIHDLQLRRLGPIAVAVALLSACGGGHDDRNSDGDGLPLESAGQVATPVTATVSVYAAARFAEQASFGASPALIADIQAKGFAGWIDAQFALAPSQINVAPYLTEASWSLPSGSLEVDLGFAFGNMAIGAPDQLRVRTTWALSQVIVTSVRKVDMVGTLYWVNLLQRQAFSLYPQLLYQVSTSPAMGWYLDNAQNRPKSANCPTCAPNENFARELMQLFSLGVYKLNADGTPVKDAQGRWVETYKQRDVEELARALTGWTWDPNPAVRPQRNFANWGKPMLPSTVAADRDTGAKTVLGKVLPAGQSHVKDLQDVTALLSAHPNAAPFVAKRLIQHLVKSNPTPAYLGRVAAKFRNNGAGVVGDMKAVVKAVLLDTEARAGDNPAGARRDDGKIREPFLQFTATWRGLGCVRAPGAPNAGPQLPRQQRPLSAESVFNFYAPTDRATGSGLLAPEVRLINPIELADRMGRVAGLRYAAPNLKGLDYARQSGCAIDAMVTAYTQSPQAFADFIEQRWFRSALPPPARSDIVELIRDTAWSDPSNEGRAAAVLDFMLGTSHFGAIL